MQTKYMPETIQKMAVLLTHHDKLLFTRESGLDFWILPGGRPEPGETPPVTLRREIKEELASGLAGAPRFLGVFTDVAAGDPTRTVEVHLYAGKLIGEPKASSEIIEIRWMTLDQALQEPLAPSIRNKIIPFLRRQMRRSD